MRGPAHDSTICSVVSSASPPPRRAGDSTSTPLSDSATRKRRLATPSVDGNLRYAAHRGSSTWATLAYRTPASQKTGTVPTVETCFKNRFSVPGHKRNHSAATKRSSETPRKRNTTPIRHFALYDEPQQTLRANPSQSGDQTCHVTSRPVIAAPPLLEVTWYPCGLELAPAARSFRCGPLR